MTQKAKQRNGKVTSASATAMPLEDVAAAAEHMNSVMANKNYKISQKKTEAL